MSTAPPPVEREAERAARLREMKRRATGLLVVMAVVYVTLQAAAGDATWVGYALSATEGSLVGGLADWFAVTALFRHPLNIPIPHTAVIRARKDQFGETLGEFVQANFLSTEVVRLRLRSARVPERLAAWLADPANARVAAAKASDALLAIADAVKDEDVQQVIHDEIGRAVDRLPLTRMAARTLRSVTEEGRHAELVDAALVGLSKGLSNNRESLRERFSEEAPWWLPGAVEDRIFDRLLDGAIAYLDDVTRSPGHDVRKQIDVWLFDLIDRLENSPDLVARGDQLKRDLLNHPELRQWTSGMWGDFKASLREQAGEEQSPLRERIATGIVAFGERLRDDPVLLEKVGDAAESAVASVTGAFQAELAGLVSGTIARWDGEETSRKLELLLGPDLQFIRINGTVVGALAGVAIHTLSEVF